MKRIALLLAAVGLGSGCVVDTCDTGSLSVDWSFSSVNGATGLACSDIRLSSPIVDVDVFLDGSPVATFVNCYDYGVTIFDVSSGSHEVTVEGYDASGYIVTRDWFTTSVASCGDTFDVAMPGEVKSQRMCNSTRSEAPRVNHAALATATSFFSRDMSR